MEVGDGVRMGLVEFQGELEAADTPPSDFWDSNSARRPNAQERQKSLSQYTNKKSPTTSRKNNVFFATE